MATSNEGVHSLDIEGSRDSVAPIEPMVRSGNQRKVPFKVTLGIVSGFVLICLVLLVLILCGIRELNEDQQLLRIRPDGRSVENGPKTAWVWLGERYQIRGSYLLMEAQYVIVLDVKTGQRQVRKGPGRFWLEPYEGVDGDTKNAVSLRANEYIIVVDELTGESRLERGPQLYFPKHGHESIGDKEEVIDLEEYEAVITRQVNGSFAYHLGSRGATTVILGPGVHVKEFSWSAGADMETNLTMVTVKKIDTRIRQLPFWFDDIRTRDNMEFELEGIIFWQVVDVEQLVRSTGDPTSDIWHRLRARIAGASTLHSFLGFLENASRVKDDVINDELVNHSDFYASRGIRLHSMELIEVELHSDDVAERVTEEVAAEATTRLNNVEKAITQSQVQLQTIRGEHARQVEVEENAIALEEKRAQKEMLQLINQARIAEVEERNRAESALRAASNKAALEASQQNHSHMLSAAELTSQELLATQRLVILDLMDQVSRKEAGTAGMSIGVQLGKSVEEYLQALNATLPDLSDRLSLYRLHQEIQSRNATTANLAGGQAHLFVTPETVNLNLGSFGSRSEL